MNENPSITIPLSAFKHLQRIELRHIALQNAGVDNWQGYDYAMDLYRGMLTDYDEEDD